MYKTIARPRASLHPPALRRGLQKHNLGRRDTVAAFDPAMTSLYVDDLLRALSETDRILWPYINLKTKITALENELKRTLLKINTLEYTVLPDLNDQRKLIEEVLGERERQERFSVKKIKRKKEIRIRYGQQDPV